MPSLREKRCHLALGVRSWVLAELERLDGRVARPVLVRSYYRVSEAGHLPSTRLYRTEPLDEALWDLEQEQVIKRTCDIGRVPLVQYWLK